ncbi:hypothetical protein PC114_g24651 [Phytophthora cactorum]|nr:hypothetical protein PC112_g22648 [Phytophthora cactorum]KAG2875559.1 hypothetical protein PC114_g24651 [Phytophthora cactorum]
MSFVDEDSLEFEYFDDIVMIDEKQFNADKDARSFMMFDDEKVPPRSCRSKNFIPKTMFVAAAARPRIMLNHTFQLTTQASLLPAPRMDGISSLQYDELCNNIDELIQAEELVYATMHTAISSRTMLALEFPSS